MPSENISHIESLILVVGLSGAGKSTVSRALSDEGYYAIDNLPIALLPNFLALSRNSPNRFKKTSVLVDIVSEKQRDQFFDFLSELPAESASWRIIFLDAPDQTIVKRFSETRRPHPTFLPDADNTVQDAIQRDRALLQPLKERADIVIDSGRLTPHDLKRKIRTTIATFDSREDRKLRINFQSFGFKYGAPTDCDLLIDVRFLPNPYFIDELRSKTGLEPEVRDHVLGSSETTEFLEKYMNLISFLLPRYAHEGKAYVNIGVGCTGGKHRSVAISTKLSELIDSEQFDSTVSHRDVGRYLTQQKTTTEKESLNEADVKTL